MLHEGFLRHFGSHLEPSVTHTLVASPLSVEHFIGSEAGSVYGLSSTTDRWNHTELNPTTGITGLYVTGQDLVTPGLAGALSSAELTANTVTGYGTLLDILTGRDLVGDISGYKKQKEEA